MSDSDTRKELLAAKIRIDELTEDLAAARVEIERLRKEVDGLRSTIRIILPNPCPSCLQWQDSTRDARRVMRFLRHRDPVWEIALGDHPEGTPDSNLMVVRGEVIEEGLPWAMTLDDWEREEGLPDIDEEGR